MGGLDGRRLHEVLAPQVEIIMSGRSWCRPFKAKKELAEWCKDNQPYYKKRIADVNNYFCWDIPSEVVLF